MSERKIKLKHDKVIKGQVVGYYHETRRFNLTKHYCPNCGKQKVWTEKNKIEYITACSICLGCDHTFRLDDLRLIEGNEFYEEDVLKYLKENK